VTAGAAASGAGFAQSPIDVPTLVTIAPREAAPSAGAPRSSFDYEARTATTPPWDQLAPGNAPPGAIAAAIAAPAPSRPTAFTGAAMPLACRHAGYRIIIDDRSDLKSGVLCLLPDGSWELLP
jgi:hypothetical protein